MVGIQVKFKGASSLLKASGYTIEEEEEIYDRFLQDVIENPGWYLDQMGYMREFRVSWVDYKTQNCTKPYKYVNQNLKRESFINKTTPI